MSSSYAAAISVLTSDGSFSPPPRPQTSPDTTSTRRTAAFCPYGKSARNSPVAQTRSHEPFDEQQENPEDYGIGEQHLQEEKTSLWKHEGL